MKIANILALSGYGLREEFNDNHGGAALGEKEFQGKVLDGLKSQKATTDDLVSNFDNLDKKTKDIFEDLTKQKEAFEGTSGQVSEMQHTFKKLQLQLKNEQRAANGDPIKKMLADPDARLVLNAKIRKSAGRDLTEAQQKALTSGSTPG